MGSEDERREVTPNGHTVKPFQVEVWKILSQGIPRSVSPSSPFRRSIRCPLLYCTSTAAFQTGPTISGNDLQATAIFEPRPTTTQNTTIFKLFILPLANTLFQLEVSLSKALINIVSYYPPNPIQ